MRPLQKVSDFSLSARGILLYQTTLKKSQYLELSDLKNYQFQRVKALLVASARDIEYYRKAFWEIGFDPVKDFRELDDLARIPILTKQQARQNHADLFNAGKVRNALEFYTSGSTGEPFLEYVSPNHWIVEQGIVWRHWKWAGYKFRDKMAIVRTFVPRRGEPLWRLDRARNFMYFSAYHLNLSNAKAYLTKLREWRPLFLRGYPTSLYILARMANELSIQIEGIKGIFTASETLPDMFRTQIEQEFNSRIFDWYGQAEETITLNECERHEGLHINMEYGICELVPAPEKGKNWHKIVATCLHNYAMPLIRYDTGDFAVVEKSECTCGRGLPLVKAISGRSDDILHAPDGRMIPSVNFYTMFDKYLGIQAFQIIQHSLDVIEVRLQCTNFTSGLRSSIENELRERLGEGMKIEFVTNVEMEQTSEGKKRVVISKIKF